MVSTKRPGRPRKPDEIRELVVKIAQETGWGYTRVLGQLRRLGILDISRQTVVNMLRQAGHDPGPQRGPGSWDELIQMHAETLWQCDFFSKRVLSRLGMPQLFAMVFLNVATRKVWISPATRHPTEIWVEEQARAFTEYAKAEDLKVDLVSLNTCAASHDVAFFGNYFNRLLRLRLVAITCVRLLRRILRRLEMIVGHLQVVLRRDRLAVANPFTDNVYREAFSQFRLVLAAVVLPTNSAI